MYDNMLNYILRWRYHNKLYVYKCNSLLVLEYIGHTNQRHKTKETTKETTKYIKQKT
jgi:hypothetical protein